MKGGNMIEIIGAGTLAGLWIMAGTAMAITTIKDR